MSLVCPQCGSDKIRSGTLHGHDGVHHMLLHKPLRCRKCHHRFWVFSPFKPLLLLVTVGALVGVTAWLALDQHASMPAAQAPASVPHARAAQGDVEAQLQLGMRYAEGDGVIQNDKEAAKWLALAAKQGLTEAEYQYGLALLRGRGVVQDYKAAFSWIEKPAHRGYARAQYSLGELYRYGTGTAPDKARAYLWFNLAAAQGVDVAAKARDNLVWQLKPEQIAAMQEEARRMSHAMSSSASPPTQAAPADTP
ncbi:tetratricopeptide repeat protein [Thiobacillus denitrificans]|uniref:Sel1 repeat-containing protein n=1 Tax=Thiobacillus denitrificans TaxID=36861 RepID=A0A106BPF9_THIDE|nr:tetratricopeptide repeat protein [Thiobacillus denitrificans]KVW96222.1 Sel1 repeat-containing protein [Thiobacillus denitrificans]